MLGKRDNSNKQAGFTLFEVMIAFSLFSVFIMAFMAGQNNNIETSINLKEEIVLQNLCEQVINKIILNPPEFKEQLTLVPEVKSFEDKFKKYEYKVEYKKFKIPNFFSMGGNNSEQKEQLEEDLVQKRIYDEMSKFLEDSIWQVIVTVTNKETKFFYSLSTWLENEKAKSSISI